MRRSSRRARLAGLVLAPCVASACAAPATEAETALPLRDAEASTDSAVVALVRTPTACGSLPSIRCTGTLVGPRAVLTAAHCLDGLTPDTLAVADGADLAVARRVHAVAELLRHPTYTPEPLANDLALVVLAEPITDLAPLPLATAAIGPADVGRSVRVVGYGHPGDGPIDGIRRQGTNVVQSADDGSFLTVPGPALACNGDSGGPLLAQGTDGVERVAGVTSWGDTLCVSEASNVQVAAHLGFLGSALERARTAPVTGPPATSCPDAVPDAAPPPDAGSARLLGGCAAVATSRRGAGESRALLLAGLVCLGLRRVGGRARSPRPRRGTKRACAASRFSFPP